MKMNKFLSATLIASICGVPALADNPTAAREAVRENGAPFAQRDNDGVDVRNTVRDARRVVGEVTEEAEDVVRETVRERRDVVDNDARNVRSGENRTTDTEMKARSSQRAVTNYFAGKLMLMNKSTIDMSSMAVKEAESEDVREFAQKLQKAHTELNRKLAKVAPGVANQISPDRMTNQKTTTAGDTVAVTTRRVNRDIDGAIAEKAAPGKRMSAHSPIHRILTVQQQATDNYLQSSSQMLSKREGREFDMSFLGFQVGAHTWALAELEAMENVGDPQLQKIVDDARQSVKSHLKAAQELTREYESHSEHAEQTKDATEALSGKSK